MRISTYRSFVTMAISAVVAGAGVVVVVSAGAAQAATPAYGLDMQANVGELFTVNSPGGPVNTSQGMKSGTSPSDAAIATGGYEEAFQANTGSFVVVGTAANTNTGLGMLAGTSPAIAGLSGSGFEAAFQANTGKLVTYGNAQTLTTTVGMKAGTSPGIAALSTGGFEAVVQSSGGYLTKYGTAGTAITTLGMASGTSPAIAGLVGGGFEVAFTDNNNDLVVYGNAQNLITTLGVMPGTSPSIAALADGGFEVAFQANTGHLVEYGTAATATTPLLVRAGTNPAITGVAGSHGFEIAYQNSTSYHLMTYDGSTSSDTGQGMMSGTSPAISASFAGSGSFQCGSVTVTNAGESVAADRMIMNACSRIGSGYYYGGGHGASPLDPATTPFTQESSCNASTCDDCSGMVRWAYYVTTATDGLNGASGWQLSSGPGSIVSTSSLWPGDLVFYGPSGKTHVGIYIGGGYLVNDLGSREGLVVTSEGGTGDGSPTGARRVL
jgi:cell wall-associated NlpC family hydrolase